MKSKTELKLCRESSCRWVPVGERLPKEILDKDGFYIAHPVLLNGKILTSALWKPPYWSYGSGHFDNVTHWLEGVPPVLQDAQAHAAPSQIKDMEAVQEARRAFDSIVAMSRDHSDFEEGSFEAGDVNDISEKDRDGSILNSIAIVASEQSGKLAARQNSAPPLGDVDLAASGPRRPEQTRPDGEKKITTARGHNERKK